jgi:hypothetical protein
MTSTDANSQSYQYFDLADQPVDEYVGSGPETGSAICGDVAAWLPSLPAALGHCGYVDAEAETYWPERRPSAYVTVHRLGDNTYEETFVVPVLRADDPDDSEYRNEEVREAFEHLRDAWYAKSARMGVLRDMVILPEYQRIIGLGRPALPWIIDSMRKEPHHWSWALTAITGENPAAGSMTLKEAADRWIAWYDSH